MVVIAHAGHWTLGLLEAMPLFVVAAFALWKSRDEHRRDSGSGLTETT
jgi:hypothetical protein